MCHDIVFIGCLLSIGGLALAQPTESSSPSMAAPTAQPAMSSTDYARTLQNLLSFESQFSTASERATFRALLDRLGRYTDRRRPTGCLYQRAAGTADMANIHNELRGFSDDVSRLSVIGLVAQTHCLTVSQVKSVVIMLTTMQARLDALIQLRPRVTNPKGFHTVLTLLDAPKMRMKLLDALKASSTTP